MGLCTADTFNKYFTVAVLTAINLLNYMDRFTLAGIITQLENVKRNGFHIDGHNEPVDDTEAGLLQTAFIASYMILSPLFGYLGDRYTRKYIIFFGILLWSAFTLTGSFSVDYWMLFVTRLFVGVGEASYATIAPTLIADLFPAEKRLRMLSIFYIAMPLGGALGYIVGSQVSALVNRFAGQADSWRWALRVTPSLGVIAALLILLVVREPPRGHTDGQRSSKGVKGKSGFVAYLMDVLYCLKNKTFVFSTLGFTTMTFSTGALAQWAPTFIKRVSYIVSNGMDEYSDTKASLLFGGITVVAGISGTVAGSELSKQLGKYTRKAEAIVCATGMLLATPFLFLAIVVAQYRQLYVAWMFVFLAEFFLCLNWAPVAAMLLYTIVPARRSTAEAIQILISHLFGDAVSPTIVGGISDSVYSWIGQYKGEKYGKAISMEFALFTTVFMCVLGGGAFLISTLTVERDRRAVELYTVKQNSRIQRRGTSDSDEVTFDDSSGDFDEHKQLLNSALKENDVVVGYNST